MLNANKLIVIWGVLNAVPSFAAVGDRLVCSDMAGKIHFSAAIYAYGTKPDEIYGLEQPSLTGFEILNKYDEAVATFLEPMQGYHGELNRGKETFSADFNSASSGTGRDEVKGIVRLVFPQGLIDQKPGFRFQGNLAIQTLPYSANNPAKNVSLNCVLE